MSISVVIPVYGCVKSLEELISRLSTVLKKISDEYEIILVNDNSYDKPWNKILELNQKVSCVKGISLSRNFGQHSAITAGIDYSNADWVVVMDCDLQDVPEEIERLYNKAQEGFDIVVGRRVERQDRFFKRLGSRLFYKVFDYFADEQSDSSINNFGIYSKKVISNFKKLREQNRFFPLFIKWLGFTKAEIEVSHAQRADGKSSYSFGRLLSLAFNTIVSYSNKPLKIAIKIGFFISLFSFGYGLYLIIRHFIFIVPVEGWTSVIVSIFFMGGLIIANLGIVGLYVGKVFDEVKDRPLYVIADIIDVKKT